MSDTWHEWQMVHADENRYVEYFDDLFELSERVADIKLNHDPNFKYLVRLTLWDNDKGRVDDFYIENNQLNKIGDYGHRCPKMCLYELDNYPFIKTEGEAK